MPGQYPSKPRPFLQVPISDIWGAKKSQQIQMWPENKHILEPEECQGTCFWQVPIPTLLPPTFQRPGMLNFYSEQTGIHAHCQIFSELHGFCCIRWEPTLPVLQCNPASDHDEHWNTCLWLFLETWAPHYMGADSIWTQSYIADLAGSLHTF